VSYIDITNRQPQYQITPDLLIAKDHYGWIVREWTEVHDPFRDKMTCTPQDSFYSTLAGAAKACLDKQIDHAESLEAIPGLIAAAEKRILAAIQG
jgi:hypothetical protein